MERGWNTKGRTARHSTRVRPLRRSCMRGKGRHKCVFSGPTEMMRDEGGKMRVILQSGLMFPKGVTRSVEEKGAETEKSETGKEIIIPPTSPSSCFSLLSSYFLQCKNIDIVIKMLLCCD